jgi:hypothetical protein
MPDRLQAGERYTGNAGLKERLGLNAPDPAVISIVGARKEKQVVEPTRTINRYRAAQDYGDSAVMDLKFALRYEPVDLCIQRLAFEKIDKNELTAWINGEPSGAYARRAWFFYEWLTGDLLDVPEPANIRYVPALDPEIHVVLSQGVRSRRHLVIDNLLGTPALCPMVRKTRKIVDSQASGIQAEAARFIQNCDPQTLARAVQYLHTKETKGSFELEKETAGGSKAERFIEALRSVRDFDPGSEAEQTRLQNIIVDPRYAAEGWRNFQNYVGETAYNHQYDIVHFICPKPEDVRPLMDGFAKLIERLRGGGVDPVIAAAAVAFAFVFIHPFEDGNGRIHRYLIHYMLDEAGFTPPGVVFPVSAAMVRTWAAYDKALERFSRAVMKRVDWGWRDGGAEGPRPQVTNRTDHLYRYFDATPQAEYLYGCVIDAVRRDLKEEVAFITAFDRAYRAVTERIDIPNRKAGQLVKLVMQNGLIGKDKREKLFPELTAAELDELEALVKTAASSIISPNPIIPPDQGAAV